MNKGFLFLIPMGLSIVVGLIANLLFEASDIASAWWATGTLLPSITVVAFYIRNSKNQDHRTEPGRKT